MSEPIMPSRQEACRIVEWDHDRMSKIDVVQAAKHSSLIHALGLGLGARQE